MRLLLTMWPNEHLVCLKGLNICTMEYRYFCINNCWAGYLYSGNEDQRSLSVYTIFLTNVFTNNFKCTFTTVHHSASATTIVLIGFCLISNNMSYQAITVAWLSYQGNYFEGAWWSHLQGMKCPLKMRPPNYLKRQAPISPSCGAIPQRIRDLNYTNHVFASNVSYRQILLIYWLYFKYGFIILFLHKHFYI